LCSEVHKRITLAGHGEELTQQWEYSVVVPILGMGDKVHSRNCRGITLLSASYKILSHIIF
jgi:hypothetical protein